jgi:hypothetical protein
MPPEKMYSEIRFLFFGGGGQPFLKPLLKPSKPFGLEAGTTQPFPKKCGIEENKKGLKCSIGI